MKPGSFAYLCREGTRNILSNKLMSLASIGVLVACMLLIGSAAMFSLNVNSMVGYVEQQNEIIVFLDENVRGEELDVIDLSIRNMENILDVTFVSREETLVSLNEQVDDEYADLFVGLEGEENPLLDSYIIRVRDLSIFDETITALRDMDGIVKVKEATEVVNTLVGLRSTVNYAGIAIVIILLVVSVVIIVNTIKLTVFSRRREINIMKYVGATDSFIRLPFLIEGMLIGLLAAVISFLILGFGYTWLIGWIGENYAGQLEIIYSNAIDFWDFAMYIFAFFAGMGVVIGMVGSGFFVRKYLKV